MGGTWSYSKIFSYITPEAAIVNNLYYYILRVSYYIIMLSRKHAL